MSTLRAPALLAAIVLSGATALASETVPAPSTEQVKAWVALFTRIVDAIVADKDDCAKMANDINALVDAHRELVALGRRWATQGLTLPKEAQVQMQEEAKRMAPALQQKCATDRAVAAAFGRLK